MKDKAQYRFFEPEKDELRAFTEGEQMIIEGYAAKYNVKSHLLSERGVKFIEILESGTFRDHLNDDVYLTFNHSRDKIMATTRNKSLILSEDEIGLKFRAILNNTTDSKDLYERVLRGDLVENSFGFHENPDKQKIERTVGSVPIKRISGINNLFDVSVVTKAAYPNTEVYVRELDETKNEEPGIYNESYYNNMIKILESKQKLIM